MSLSPNWTAPNGQRMDLMRARRKKEKKIWDNEVRGVSFFFLGLMGPANETEKVKVHFHACTLTQFRLSLSHSQITTRKMLLEKIFKNFISLSKLNRKMKWAIQLILHHFISLHSSPKETDSLGTRRAGQKALREKLRPKTQGRNSKAAGYISLCLPPRRMNCERDQRNTRVSPSSIRLKAKEVCSLSCCMPCLPYSIPYFLPS